MTVSLNVKYGELFTCGVAGNAAQGWLNDSMSILYNQTGFPLGVAHIVKSWSIDGTNDPAAMIYQVNVTIDGKLYTGRTLGPNCFWRGKAKKPEVIALLSRADGNPKLAKGLKRGVLSFPLHLAPADLSGHEVCPMRSPGCTAACLNTAGRGGMSGSGPVIQAARKKRTNWYFDNRDAFMAALAVEIQRAERQAARKNLDCAIRLNATSDIAWHRVPVLGYANIMELFPNVQFYDYTKVSKRIIRETLPRNYHLTFSLSENNAVEAREVLAHGGNVTVVFRTRAMVELAISRGEIMIGGILVRAPIIDGDETDLRYLDPAGSIVALKAKGKAKQDKSGFVVDIM